MIAGQMFAAVGIVMKKIILLIVLVIAVALVAREVLRPAPVSQPQPATTTQAPQAGLKTTGVYADDWAANCGPLQGPAQSQCTARLDAAYGRTSGAPVPPPPAEGK